MPLDDKHLDEVCKLKQGARTCSFLTAGAGGFECAKGTAVETLIRRRRDAGTMNAVGDNCSGPPDFTPTNTELVFH